jgi:hypothetical protein
MSGPPLGEFYGYEVRHDQIPVGVNNKFIEHMLWEVGQLDTKVAYFTMENAIESRFSPPEDLVNKKRSDGYDRFRLDMCGLQIFEDPFGFQFTNKMNSSDVLLHTNGSQIILMDKYLQIDLQLPSRRIYGLGERTHEFELGEGAWTMWASSVWPQYDDGKGGKQSSGVHPFALVQSS